jgi:HEAT repeat protein
MTSIAQGGRKAGAVLVWLAAGCALAAGNPAATGQPIAAGKPGATDKPSAAGTPAAVRSGPGAELSAALHALQEAAAKGDAGVGALEAALKDSRPPIRTAAVQLLYAVKKTAAVPRIAPLVDDPDEGVAVETASALVKAGGDASAAPIRKALASPKPFVRAQTAGYIGDAKDKRFVKDLGALLSDETAGVRHSAVSAMRAIGDPAAFPFLMAAAGDKDVPTAIEAIGALANLKNKAAVPRLGAIAGAPSGEVRAAVAQALPALGAVDTETGPFATLLKDPEAGVRQSAASGMRESPSAANIPALKILVADKAPLVRRGAVQALREIPSRDTIPPLVQALKDADPNVRSTAVFALGTRGAVDQAGAVLALAGDPQERVRAAVASTLGDFKRPADLGALTPLGKDPSYSVRLAAVDAAGRIGTDAALPIVSAALSDADASVRRQAVTSLGLIGTPAALERLRALAATGDVESRVAAIDELRDRKDRGALEVLRKASQDPVERIREASRKALQAIGG